MAYPSVTERAGILSAVGIAKETVFGTPVAATNFLPMTGCSIVPDPGLVYPPVMMGSRELNIFALQTQYSFKGGVDGLVFPSNGITVVAGSLGSDGQATHGVTGTAGSPSTTLNGGLTAGTTTVVVTSATGLSVGDVVQIDVNTTTTTAECRKITAIATNTLTVDASISYNHLTAAAVVKVTSPFTHTFATANVLPSFTIEKQLGSYQSEQFAGCRVNKMALKSAAGTSPASVSFDVMGQSQTIMGTPTAVSVVNESPYVFAEASLTLWGSARAEVTSFTCDIENGLKDTYTSSGNRGPSYLTATGRKISGQIIAVFSSLNDGTYGYNNLMMNNNVGALSFALTHPSSAGTITIAANKVRVAKYTDGIQIGDIIMCTLNYEAELDLSVTPNVNTTISVANLAYLAY